MTTLQLEIALMEFFDIRKNLIVPNVTHMSGLVGFESDLLVLSNSGYATVIEIKVSKSDLKSDLKKSHIQNLDTNWRSYSGKNCLQYFYKNIKHFFYAVPEELSEIALNQIPDFCGLIVIKTHYQPSGIKYYSADFIRSSKVLFKTKWTDKMRYQLARLGAMRILTLKNNVNVLKNA